MAYMNWEQDHYKIKHILTKIHAMNSSTCQFINKLKKKQEEWKYLLAWVYPSVEEYFRNQRNFHFFTYKKEVLEAKTSRTSLM